MIFPQACTGGSTGTPARRYVSIVWALRDARVPLWTTGTSQQPHGVAVASRWRVRIQSRLTVRGHGRQLPATGKLPGKDPPDLRAVVGARYTPASRHTCCGLATPSKPPYRVAWWRALGCLTPARPGGGICIERGPATLRHAAQQDRVERSIDQAQTRGRLIARLIALACCKYLYLLSFLEIERDEGECDQPITPRFAPSRMRALTRRCADRDRAVERLIQLKSCNFRLIRKLIA